MMKKLLIIFSFLLFAGLTTNAQDLSLFFHTKHVGDGDTILKYGDAGAAEIVIDHLVVRNNTGKAMSILVSRERLDMQDETSSQFCWGLCYPPSTEVSPNSRLIMANSASTDEEFSGHYLPDGVLGPSYVKYKFYNENSIDVQVSIVIKYLGSPTGISEEAMMGGKVSEIYPNPASQSVSLDYQLTSNVTQASVKIYNLLGAEVKSANLENGGNRLKIDISNLDNGIYFYSIYVNGDAYKTKKLIVQK